MENITQLSKSIAQEFISFINKAVSPYHVVYEVKQLLQGNGFTEIQENDNWSNQIVKGGKYFFTRNQSTVIAFSVGKSFIPTDTGFKIIGGHTDFPALKLAPISKLLQADYIQTHVCTYGGGLWHTWFDRDLQLAGKIVYKTEKNQLDSKLFHYSKPLVKIPTLAIHLIPLDERGKFAPNNESHLRPIIAHQVYEQLSQTDYKPIAEQTGFQNSNHYGGLLKLISDTCNIQIKDIVDMDLFFQDANPATLFGLHEEFISSQRIDNLMSCFCSIKSLLDPKADSENSQFINMICLFDHEECGSQSYQGAQSVLLSDSIKRIFESLAKDNKDINLHEAYHKALQQSFVISSDTAHALHPNYSDKHKQNFSVAMNKGVVIKTNENQNYSSDSVSRSIVKLIAQKNNIPLQEFIVKNDSPCGSTIGPKITSVTGIKGVDLGVSQLSMHSIRETCGIIDLYYCKQLFVSYFQQFDSLAPSLVKL